MKHRDAYTLAGGKNMQQTRLGSATRFLAAVFVMVFAFALVACPGDDDEEIRIIEDERVEVNSNTAEILVQAGPITIDGSAFGAAAGDATLTFTDTDSFTFAQGGGTASGGVTFGSCFFTFTASSFAVGTEPQAGQTFSFPQCFLLVNAIGAVPGGDEVVGTITLVLIDAAGNRFESEPISVEIRLDDDGTLIINDVDTGIIVPPTTGATGTTGG